MKYQVWYMTPEYFPIGIFGDKKPDPANLAKTHVHLKDIEAATLDEVFAKMQGEIWSPRGEGRQLILEKGLGHTSMSVGDLIIEQDCGRIYLVSMVGFEMVKNTAL